MRHRRFSTSRSSNAIALPAWPRLLGSWSCLGCRSCHEPVMTSFLAPDPDEFQAEFSRCRSALYSRPLSPSTRGRYMCCKSVYTRVGSDGSRYPGAGRKKRWRGSGVGVSAAGMGGMLGGIGGGRVGMGGMPGGIRGGRAGLGGMSDGISGPRDPACSLEVQQRQRLPMAHQAGIGVALGQDRLGAVGCRKSWCRKQKQPRLSQAWCCELPELDTTISK